MTVLAAWLTLVVVPETPVAGMLHRWMVEMPAAVLNRITRGHVLLAALLAIVVGLVVWQMEGDGVRLLSMMAPDIVAWLTMIEVSVYIDALAAVITLTAAVRLRGMGFALRRLLPQRRPRASRARRRRARRPAANDDGEGPAFRHACAAA